MSAVRDYDIAAELTKTIHDSSFLLARQIGYPGARLVLVDMLRDLRPRTISTIPTDGTKIREVAVRVATEQNIPLPALFGRSLPYRYAPARFEVWWESHEINGYSYPQIGRVFDNRDHSTIMNGVQRWKAMTGK